MYSVMGGMENMKRESEKIGRDSGLRWDARVEHNIRKPHHRYSM